MRGVADGPERDLALYMNRQPHYLLGFVQDDSGALPPNADALCEVGRRLLPVHLWDACIRERDLRIQVSDLLNRVLAEDPTCGEEQPVGSINWAAPHEVSASHCRCLRGR